MDNELKKKRTQLIYNGIAPYYDRFRLILKRKDIPTVMKMLELNESDRVLDAGMGPGIYTFALLKKKKINSIVGVDLSPEFVSIARRKAEKKRYQNVTFRTADLENLPFQDHEFDKIICSGVLLIIPDRKKALKELFRVLKPGGRIVFVEPLNEFFIGKELFYVFAKLFLKFLSKKKPELAQINRSDFAGSYFTEQELRDLLTSVGFAEVQVKKNRVEVFGLCKK